MSLESEQKRKLQKTHKELGFSSFSRHGKIFNVLELNGYIKNEKTKEKTGWILTVSNDNKIFITNLRFKPFEIEGVLFIK